MTQEQADQKIGEWRSRISLATENLLALDDTVALKRIEGRDGYAPIALRGVTAARLTPAIAAMRELFGQIGTLTDVVEKASRLRKSLNRLWKYEETLTEIERLLTGPSISLPPIQTPLAERGLISASQNLRAISADRLLEAMVSAFRTAKEAVLAVEGAWERSGRAIDAAVAKADALAQQAESLHLAPPPEIADVRQRMADALKRVLADPLGFTEDVDAQATPLLTAARDKIAAGKQSRERVGDKLGKASALLADICQQQAAAVTALENARARGDIEGLIREPPEPARVAELESWLRDLEKTAAAERWPAALVGLEHWTSAAEALRAEEQASQAASRALGDLPSELNGRLGIVRARAESRGIAAPALARLIAQAECLLRETPIPLARASRLIEACEIRVRRETETNL